MFGDWILSEQLGTDFAARGQLYVNTSGREACAPGHRYGPAKRGYHLMHIVASGCGVFCDGRREYALKAGQGFMIFPDGVTVYTADSVTPWDYVWVGFSGAMSEQLAESAGCTPENPVFDLGRYAPKALEIAYGIYDDISLLQMSGAAALGGLLRLMAYIGQSAYDASPQRGSAAGADSFQRAMWALNANYQRADFRVEDAAAFVGLSRSQLFRIFKAQTGRSPQQVLGDLRLSHAKRLLSGTELSLTETALSSGFASAARLGEVFRDALGITPTAYRKREKE